MQHWGINRPDLFFCFLLSSQKVVQGLYKARDKKKALKARTLGAFCLNKSSQAAVENAQNDFNSREAKLSNAAELHDTVIKRIAEAEALNIRLSEKVERSRREIWDYLYMDLEKDALKAIGQKIVFLHAANVRQRRVFLYQDLLKRIFPEPTRGQL